MALTPLTGAATTTVKVSDFNAMITALNAELATLGSRIAAIENSPVVSDLGTLVTGLRGRVETLEAEPDPVIPPDLTTRVEALENLIVRSPVEAPTTAQFIEPPRPAGIDGDQPQLVYNQAVIYYHDVELHAQRIDANRWLLRSRLNYITLASAEWTYEEIYTGTPDEVYAHATSRIRELAELKPQHDAVHTRVREMSEGQE